MLLFVLTSLSVFPSAGVAQPREHQVDAISGGAEANRLAQRVVDYSRLKGSPISGFDAMPFVPGVGFLAYNFDDNSTETGGWLFIPPDPMGAAGTDRVIAVVNVGIECRDKTGTLLFRDALRDFFSPLGAQTLGTFTFDPKIVYDHYENRFVVVTLEQTAVASGDPSDESRILVAVSKTSTPATATATDWWYLAINSKINIGGNDYWADYPGFEVDEEAVYITNNMFPFAAGTYGVRLWIIDKGVVGGFYAGSPASWNIYNPIPATFYDLTTMPALVFGAGGVGPGIGTFLVGYSSLTNGGPGAIEWVQVIRVDNPLGATTFTGEIVNVGDLEDVGGIYGFPNIPDAPQNGTANLIEVNDSRALDAVWRNNSLWLTTTINPNVANDPVNTGEATAHWFRLNTIAVPAPITVADQGNIGGEDIATDTWTFFPAVAVNGLGDAKFGFAASAQSMYCGAYYAGREPGDPPGTVQASGVVQAGLDYYYRPFNGPRNRWGDYSGASVDPADDTTFWIFNEYAENRGTPISGQDGRWGTAWRSCLKQNPLDFGDAPDPTYPTLLASNGARHTIVQGVFMGTLIDGEPDGLPHPNAVGDDITNLPDEDGVNFVTPLVQGQPAQFDVFVSQPGWLDIWVDFNLNGSWLDPGEQVFSGPAVGGLNSIIFAVPAAAVPGFTFARFRYNLGGPLAVTGLAPDGEVEDYEVPIEQAEPDMDFGDAPDGPYPTLLGSNGAHHVIVPNIFMGALIDAEIDGQPHSSALGDDNSNLPDEDGVAFVTPFVPGVGATVNVTTSVPGWLDVWFDFDQNGSWLDPGELVFTGPVPGGLIPIPVGVPVNAITGLTFARFRFNTGGPLPDTGFAPDGEVEDYQVMIERLDFGDAPDPTYPTILASNGARHGFFPNITMGALIDAEPDGQPDPNAMGDDLSNQPDEDGVVFVTPFVQGLGAQVDVIVSVPGWLDVWFDFNQNGSWLDTGEQIFSGAVVAGVNPVFFTVPASALSGVTFARFRFNTIGPVPVDGPVQDGEVEDYEVPIEEPQEQLDFGDAPDGPYPTLLGTNGARHTIVPNVLMGALIDAEPDGQPDASATGDDLSNQPDEDGVVFTSLLDPVNPANVDVTVSVPGLLDAWIDFDADGVWSAAEQIFVSVPVAAGLNSLTFNVPGTGAQAFQTFARFRYSTVGGLLPDGLAPDGECEDYEVTIEEDKVTGAAAQNVPTQFALHEAVPNPFNPQTTLSFSLPSANHVQLMIYDVSGRVVTTLLDENRGPGRHDVVWDGRDDLRRNVSSGVYFYRIKAGSFVETKRMVLVR
jgi:hypothetical protein